LPTSFYLLKEISHPQFDLVAVLFFAIFAVGVAFQDGPTYPQFPIGVAGIGKFGRYRETAIIEVDDAGYYRGEIYHIERFFLGKSGVEIVFSGIGSSIATRAELVKEPRGKIIRVG
jgi:hypothetical protein